MKTRWYLLAAVMMTGCRVSDVVYLPGAGGDDAGADTDGQFCYGSAPFSVCFAAVPTGTINIAMSTTFDTGTGVGNGTQLICTTPMSGGAGYCVLAAATITIDAPLRAVGTKPLVLVAADSIDVPTSIDVGSRQPPTEPIGAGSAPGAACTSGEIPGNSGGGAGGSFLGRGGTGGNGASATAGGGVPGVALDPPKVLRGGCPGQNGHAFVGADTGFGGHGGGAVFLIAGNSITVGGTLNAGGAGGGGGGNRGSDPRAGGGGGGAGGMIGLDAPHVMVTGTLIANGGGGGEGNGSANPGGSGMDADSTTAAAGGGNETTGGDGGAGSSGAANSSGLSGLNASGGGGGGGGGAGLILAPATAILGPSVSPAATR